jgi:hypothetical protein
MKISSYDEQEIEITAVYFRASNQRKQLETYPKRMLVNGQEYDFMESGMRYLISKGQDLIKLFDVSDGHNQYRLRLDGQHWTLVGTKSAI